MPCYYPRTAFQHLQGGPLYWRERKDMRQLQLPCQQCVGCRLRRSSEWATRIMHEAKTHRYNCWLTLTYDDAELPSRYYTGIIHPKTAEPIYSGTLYKPHPQKFFRRIRKALSSKKLQQQVRMLSGGNSHELHAHNTVRYYMGGEYGEQYGRPHYHVCLFGIEFNDQKYLATTDSGYKLYTSEILTKLWPHGTHTIGQLNWQTAAYTARYIMKKWTGKQQKQHYEKLDHETGEIINALPEYNDMSRKPGIAKPWLTKYVNDVYPHDTVIVRGKITKPPRYYDKLYAEKFPEEMEQIKFARQLEANLHWRDHTDERLKVQEIVTKRRIQSLKRKI